MLFVLGVGSAVALHSAIITAVWDAFPKLKYWQVALGLSIIGYFCGLVYVTPVRKLVVTIVIIVETNCNLAGWPVDSGHCRSLWWNDADIRNGHY